MKMEGHMFTCDRCGYQLFVPAVRDRYYNVCGGNASPGHDPAYPGFTSMPSGWEHHQGFVGLLCPSCTGKFNKVALEFMERKGEKST